LEKQGYNFTVELDEGLIIDVKSTLINGFNKVCDGYPDKYNCGAVGDLKSRKLETALELIIPIFPMEKMRAFMTYYAEDALESVQRSVQYFSILPFILALLIIGLVGSVAMSVSLKLSDAKEDKSGKCLARWNKFGIPVILFLYFLVGTAVVLFAVVVGSFPPMLDTYIFGMVDIYSSSFYGFTLPVLTLIVLYCGWLTYSAQMKTVKVSPTQELAVQPKAGPV
jgi:hypothetical protein